MPKGSTELTNARKHEIIDACAKLYETMSFKEITMKDIGNATSFTRTSIYNYFQTKEEIFLALLEREYAAWNLELNMILHTKEHVTGEELAALLAESLSKREFMLKLLSMNIYDIEENSSLEKLVEFKQTFCESLNTVSKCLSMLTPKMPEAKKNDFLYSFFPFMHGIYPYTSPTPKQLSAMQQAGLDFKQHTIYEIAYTAIKKLLEL